MVGTLSVAWKYHPFLIDLPFIPVRTRNKKRSTLGWEFYSTKFYTGRFGPEVQPLLTEKVPLSYTSVT